MKPAVVSLGVLVTTIGLVYALQGTAQTGDDSYLADPAGDAAGKDSLDIVKGGIKDENTRLTMWLEVKSLANPNPDPQKNQLKHGWRFYIKASNETDPAKARTEFVHVQIGVLNDQTLPTALPNAASNYLGLGWYWGHLKADGTIQIISSSRPTNAAGGLDVAKNRVTFAIDIATFRQDAATSPQVQLDKTGKIDKIWAESLDNLCPVYESTECPENAAVNLAKKWNVIDSATLQTRPFLLNRELNAPATTASTGGTNATASPTGNATASPTGNGTASPTGNATGNETGGPATATDTKGKLPGAGAVLTLLGVSALVVGLRGRRGRGPE